MKRLTICLAVAAMCASVALAETTTVKFERDDGTVQTATFKADGTVSTDSGIEGTYTHDQDSGKVCIESAEYNGCITASGLANEVGASAPYTTDNGAAGVATVTAKED